MNENLELYDHEYEATHWDRRSTFTAMFIGAMSDLVSLDTWRRGVEAAKAALEALDK